MFRLFKKLKKRTFYEGARRTKKNRDFWNANAPFEATAMGERDTLRARARWLSENNAIMANIDNSILVNVVGTGISPQLLTDDKDANNEIERAFVDGFLNSKNADILGEQTFAELQWTMIKTRMIDGEVFIHLVNTIDGLKLQLIEADALDVTQKGHGIERDKYGKPKAYWFKELDDNGMYAGSKRVKAEDVIHLFKKMRPTQGRGVSEYKQSIISIKNFSAFTDATIEGARARASIGYVVQADGAVQHNSITEEENEKIQSIGNTEVYYLRPGESISKTAPGSSDTEFNNFSTIIIRLIATARSVSYELAFKDLSKVNYASGRAAFTQDYKLFDKEQYDLTHTVLNRVFDRWLELEILSSRLKYRRFLTEAVRKAWTFPKRSLMDPLKEAQAMEKEIELNMLTQSELASRNGRDFEDIVAKKAHEQEILAKYNMQEVDNAE